MTNGKKRNQTKFETDGKGNYTWEVITQKPFAEFRQDVDQAYENNWLRFVIRREWDGKTVKFNAWTGAKGDAKWGDGKVLVDLHVHGFPAKSFEKAIVFDVR